MNELDGIFDKDSWQWTDEDPPPFYAQTAILCMRPAVNDFGFGGLGQHLQFHLL